MFDNESFPTTALKIRMNHFKTRSIKLHNPTHFNIDYPLDILWNDYYPVYHVQGDKFRLLPPKDFIRQLDSYMFNNYTASRLILNGELWWNFSLYQMHSGLDRADSIYDILKVVKSPNEANMWKNIKRSQQFANCITALEDDIERMLESC